MKEGIGFLVEKTGKLGGTLNFTDTDADKVDLRNFKNMLIREVEKDPAVRVLLNTAADRQLIADLDPDAVVISVGAEAVVPSLAGIETAVQALDVYSQIDQIGQNVVLIGGGLVGCETGLYLAHHGRNVTVVEMNNMMAFETFGYYRNALLDEMDKRKITQYLGTKCLEIKPDGIVAEVAGKETFIPADTVVYSMGMKAKTALTEELKKASGDRDVYVIGDCAQAGKVGDAVRGGYMAALQIV